MRYGVIENGQLVEKSGNIVWSPNHFQTAESLSEAEKLQFGVLEITDVFPELADNEVVEGFSYDIEGNQVTRTWLPRTLSAEEQLQRYRDSVPKVVTMRQAKLALHVAGMLTAVNAVVAQADETVKIEWEYAAEVERNWPTLIVLQPLLGLSDEQIDQLFISAAAL